MSREPSAHHLLGRPNEGNLILLVGPSYERVQETAKKAGIATRDAFRAGNVDALAKTAAAYSASLALIAVVAEVEGLLDRTSFGSRLTDLAYTVDRVVYCGTQGAALVHPRRPHTRMEVRGGIILVHQKINVIKMGEAASWT
jgi:hypothetical protein